MEMISSSKKGSKSSSLMSIMREWQMACDGSDNSVPDAESSQYSISLYPGPQWWSWCPPCRNCSQAQQRGQQRHGQDDSIGALCTGVPASAWIRTVGRRQEALCGPDNIQDADYGWRGHTVGYYTFRPETLHTGEWMKMLRYHWQSVAYRSLPIICCIKK